MSCDEPEAAPPEYDHRMIIGDTYAPGILQLVDDTGAPIDLTGSTGEVQVRETPTSALLLEPTYSVSDGPTGRFTWTAPASETALVPAGVYRYAVRITYLDGTVRTELGGKLIAVRTVIA